MTKLKCFTCTLKFKRKSEIFRDFNNYPICKDCLREELFEDWDDDFYEYVLSEIEKNFNRSYAKWSKWFYKNHETCDGEHDIDWYILKKDLIEIDGNKYCPACVDLMNKEEEKERELENKMSMAKKDKNEE